MGLGIDPTGQRFRAVAGCDVDHDTPIKIDKARHKHGSVIIGRRKPCGFIHPQRPGLTDALGVLDERLTVFVDGVHHRVPRDPELLATFDTEQAFTPTSRQHHTPARRVRMQRLPSSSDRSVHVSTMHAGSMHRYRRFRHTNLVGRPNAGRSW